MLHFVLLPSNSPAAQAADAAHCLAKPSSSEAAALIANHMKYIPLQESSECKLSQVAAAKCIQLSKLSHNEAKELGKLFPSCAGTKRGQPSFDPHQEFHGLPDKKKKKRASTSQGRPVSVTVCCLPHSTPFIPKGKVRNNLKKQGRIQDILLTRSMTSSTVRDSITRAFKDIHNQWVYLEAGQDNLLSETKQSLDGNAACSRRGCLYIMEKQVRCMPAYLWEHLILFIYHNASFSFHNHALAQIKHLYTSMRCTRYMCIYQPHCLHNMYIEPGTTFNCYKQPCRQCSHSHQ